MSKERLERQAPLVFPALKVKLSTTTGPLEAPVLPALLGDLETRVTLGGRAVPAPLDGRVLMVLVPMVILACLEIRVNLVTKDVMATMVRMVQTGNLVFL